MGPMKISALVLLNLLLLTHCGPNGGTSGAASALLVNPTLPVERDITSPSRWLVVSDQLDQENDSRFIIEALTVDEAEIFAKLLTATQPTHVVFHFSRKNLPRNKDQLVAQVTDLLGQIPRSVRCFWLSTSEPIGGALQEALDASPASCQTLLQELSDLESQGSERAPSPLLQWLAPI
jgi:hypothetical protein